jgi:DNA polymerase-3 subunit beta
LLTAVATDRKCLALAVEPLPLPDLEMVIELEALDVLTRHLSQVEEVELALSPERVKFRLPRLEISGRLLNGDFPDYERVLPQEFATRAEVNRLWLLALVDGAERFNRQTEPVIELAVSGHGDDGLVEVGVDHPAGGNYHSRVTATVTGQPGRGRFLSRQLAQALRALPTAEIALEFAAGEHVPVILRAGQNKQVLMPMAG